MIHKKRIFVFVIFVASLFSISANGQGSTPTEPLKPVTMEEARQFIEAYQAQFMKLDLGAYMAFFSKEAVENRMLPYADIREAYRRTIERSESILYHLKIYSIQTYAQKASIRGRYEIIQTPKSKGRARVFKGNIQWEVVRENGALKIKEINYGRDR